jgi:uncharacterized protein DUF885
VDAREFKQRRVGQSVLLRSRAGCHRSANFRRDATDLARELLAAAVPTFSHSGHRRADRRLGTVRRADGGGVGLYRDDPIGLLGELDSELFRARRLVVDTGTHAKHWTRQQAIDYGIEPSEVERYVVTPGQACAYMIGELKILELRDKARKALGAKFDIRAFHHTVLSAGMVPLSQLERIVDEYIKKTTEAGRAHE